MNVFRNAHWYFAIAIVIGCVLMVLVGLGVIESPK